MELLSKKRIEGSTTKLRIKRNDNKATPVHRKSIEKPPVCPHMARKGDGRGDAGERTEKASAGKGISGKGNK